MALFILSDTFRMLRERCDELPSVKEVFLGRYFTTVLLSDGTVGSAMSYYSASDEDLKKASAFVSRSLASSSDFLSALEASEPLLKGCLLQPRLLIASLSTAIVSALSDSLIRGGGDESFNVTSDPPMQILEGVNSALVVGFGGLLEQLALSPEICRVHVIDLSYKARSQEIDSALMRYRRLFPHKEFIASEATKPEDNFDLVSISGSTLCNESLANFLPYSSRGTRLILQGQSAAIAPNVLFSVGISLVITTLKPPCIAEAAQKSFGGDELRSYLEGGLPWVYLTPRYQTAM